MPFPFSVMSLVVVPSGTFHTSWDGGSRDTYWWADRRGRVANVVGTPDPDKRGDPFGQRKVFPAPPEGTVALINGGIFCGKQSHLIITLLPPLSRGDLA